MKNKFIFYIIFIIAFITGCGVWNDFTTYFNRYYNTKTLFEEAEQGILNEQKYIFEFRTSAPAQSKVKLEKVVETASKLLQYNSESSFVNDALFIIGKAFYYQQNFLKAERKFSELSVVKNDDLFLKNKLWLGKTKLQLRDFENGIKIINAVIDSATVIEENQLLSEAIITKISFWIYREDIGAAISDCKELLSVSDDDQFNAEISYELGKLYLEQSDLENAVLAFANVNNYSPTFEIQFLSALEEARLRKNTEEYEKSIEILEDLKSEPKFEKDRDLIEVEIAQVFYLQGKIDEAVEKFIYIDTAYTKTVSAGIAAFMRGRIFEDQNILDSALVYYSKCATGVSPPEYKSEAIQKKNSFNIYVNLRKELNKFRKQMGYSIDSLLFIKDSLQYWEQRERDSLLFIDQAAEKNVEPNLKILVQQLDLKKKEDLPVLMNLSTDSLKVLVTLREYELANFFFNEGLNIDSAKYYFDTSLQNYPDSMITAPVLFTAGSFYEIYGDTLKANSLYEKIYYHYSSNILANEAAARLGLPLYEKEKDPAKGLYEAAEDLLIEKKYPAAISGFKNIFNSYPESLFAPKSLYTVGWIFENELGVADSAISYYDSLTVRYPLTVYAREVKNQLSYYKSEIKKTKEIISDLQNAKPDSLVTFASDSTTARPISDSLHIHEDNSIKSSGSDSVNVPVQLKKEKIREEEKTNSESPKKPDSLLIKAKTDSVKKTSENTFEKDKPMQIEK